MSDPDSSPALAGRSWRWLLVRIRGLLESPGTRLVMALTPDPPQTPAAPPPSARPDTYDHAD